LGGREKRPATSLAVPRTISSNRFVSSLQTAIGRSGCAAASDASVPGSRCGDSNATAGQDQARELLPERRELPLPARQIAEELVALADQTARDEGGRDGGGAGQER